MRWDILSTASELYSKNQIPVPISINARATTTVELAEVMPPAVVMVMLTVNGCGGGAAGGGGSGGGVTSSVSSLQESGSRSTSLAKMWRSTGQAPGSDFRSTSAGFLRSMWDMS